MASSTVVTDEFVRDYLHGELRWIREAIVWKIDGLDEYDIRRPLTPTHTHLLRPVKHLAIWEARYLGEVFDRPYPGLPNLFRLAATHGSGSSVVFVDGAAEDPSSPGGHVKRDDDGGGVFGRVLVQALVRPVPVEVLDALSTVGQAMRLLASDGVHLDTLATRSAMPVELLEAVVAAGTEPTAGNWPDTLNPSS